MISSKFLRMLKLNKPNVCLLCSKPIEIISHSENSKQIVLPNKQNGPPQKIKRRRKKHLLGLEDFFQENPNLLEYKEFIPEALLFYTPYFRPEYMYLICPNIAKKVANHVMPSLRVNKNNVVAETNAGFGFISRELIKQGIPVVRVYEKSTEFQQVLRTMRKEELDCLQLFNRDLFRLHLYSHIDRYDQGKRVTILLEGVPKKSWVDDPVMTIVGTMTDLSFVKYLLKAIVFQKEIATYGRLDIFALMFPKDWAILNFNSTTNGKGFRYRPWTILFEIFFEVKLLDKFPRKFFLPWQTRKDTKELQGGGDLKAEQDYVCLVQISMKKDFCLNAEQFVPFFCFSKTFLGLGNKLVIPTCEKWVPHCGVNLIAPKLKHEDYFEDMDIFTRFKELNANQTVGVFKELSSLPGYASSPFMDMVEQEMIKSETISSDIHETHNKYKKTTPASELESNKMIF